MGCGNSKLNPEGELVPPRVRPLLLRSKIRKRKNGINLRDGALSKKVLLNDRELEVEENSMLVDNANSKSMPSSPNGNGNGSPKKSLALKQDEDEDSPIPLSLSNNATTHVHPHPDELKHNDTRVEFKPHKTMDEHTYVDQQRDENKKAGEEARPDNEDNRCFICPGSPSFRVYFVEETKNDKESGMDDVSHKKSPSHDSVESTTSAKFGEGQENKMIKKGKKGTSFNRVISKKRPVGVGVKNLLNVKSCYHLSCSGNDGANLLARKAEA